MANVAYIVALVVVVAVSAADAIRCYGRAPGDLNQFDCSGSVNNPPLDKCKKVQCNSGGEQYCIRVTAKGSSKPGADYTRLDGCLDLTDPDLEPQKRLAREKKCTTVKDKQGYSVTTCYCSTDLCNGVEKTVAHIFVVLVALMSMVALR